jgi:hypothetical protein
VNEARARFGIVVFVVVVVGGAGCGDGLSVEDFVFPIEKRTLADQIRTHLHASRVHN